MSLSSMMSSAISAARALWSVNSSSEEMKPKLVKIGLEPDQELSVIEMFDTGDSWVMETWPMVSDKALSGFVVYQAITEEVMCHDDDLDEVDGVFGVFDDLLDEEGPDPRVPEVLRGWDTKKIWRSLDPSKRHRAKGKSKKTLRSYRGRPNMEEGN